MKFYVKQHKYYCGVDLHARTMYVCIIDKEGAIVKQKNIDSGPDEFLQIIEPYREDIVVAVECMFAWYWLSDLCSKGEYPLCPWTCPLYESHSWRQGKERQDRFP